MRRVPCNIASLIIKHISHCAYHDSMHLPFPALLTKLFKHFCIVSEYDESERLSTIFDCMSCLQII